MSKRSIRKWRHRTDERPRVASTTGSYDVSFGSALKDIYPTDGRAPRQDLNSKGQPGPCNECGRWTCVCGATDVPDAYLSPYGGTSCSVCRKKDCRTALETTWGPGSLELCWPCFLAGPTVARAKWDAEYNIKRDASGYRVDDAGARMYPEAT